MAKKKPATIANDNLSKSLKNLIGDISSHYKGSDEFVDIISWNLRWFNHREKERLKNITQILGFLNADIFVFQEVQEGSLEEVVTALEKSGAGYYNVIYGSTGGGQRIAYMYDTEWVRTKDDVSELFGKGVVKTGDNKEVFPRLPLYSYFLAKSSNASKSGFSFQMLGVHLKSQMGDGSSQRRIAAEKLAHWLEKEANDVDADTIIMGDWNKAPNDNDWAALHKLESEKKVKFKSINDASDFSHLYYQNKTDIGSRLDIALVTSSASKQMIGKRTEVANWLTVNDIVKTASTKTAAEINTTLNNIKDNISDHMPLLSRYFFLEE
jgi:endonuclease/exonuclease/phosphatase family metal-dependent hydrolase